MSSADTHISSIDSLEFTWDIKEDLFTTFLAAKSGEGFESKEFSFCGGSWKLKCYPNGTKKYGQGNVSLFLAVSKLPPGIIQLGVQYEFECKEVNYRDEYGSELTNIFNKKHSSWGYPETFKRNLLINLQKKSNNLKDSAPPKLTITCRMKRVLSVGYVTMPNINSPNNSSLTMMNSDGSSNSIGSSYHSDGEIISDKERINKCSHNITWHIDPLMLRTFIKSQTKQSWDSTPFNLYRTKWCLQAYPNGDKYANTGMVSLYLKLLEFPESNAYHIRNMKVKMLFECPDIQYQSNEFIHAYENKKQEVYFGISSAFNTFQLNYLAANQGISIKCRIDLVAVSIDGERWWHCIRERDNLKSKAKRAEHEAKEQNKKLQTSYICNKVITIKEIQPKIREKIKRINDESQSILRSHQKILKEWDLTTNALKKVIGNDCNINILKKEEDKDEDDKKKKDINDEEGQNEIDSDVEDMDSVGYDLLNEYSKCQHIMDEQNNRLEQVSKNVSGLLQQQSNFLHSIQEWKDKQISGRKEFTETLKKYNEIKFERIKLQQILQEKVNECNAKIDEENGLNKRKCNKDNELNSMNLEIKVFEQMSKDCNKLLERYNEFVKINDENIKKLNKFIMSKWNNFEKNWIEWNAKDIMAFIKYKMHWFGGVHLLHLDLNKIELNMVKQDINGLALKNFDKNDLYSVGFTNYQLRCQIFEHIRILRAKYPAPKIIIANGTRKEKNDEDNDEHKALNGNGSNKIHRGTSDSERSDTSGSNNIIPSKFICPLTKNLMTDPVMAFDGYTYERSAIEQYLKKHKKSPKTKNEAHTLCLFPNLQLQQEIETFRAVNDIHIDGDEETHYIE